MRSRYRTLPDRRVFGALHLRSEGAAAGARAAEGKRHPAAVREVSLQRVYMRNEMFKEPLTSEELESWLQSHTPPRKACPERRNDTCISVVCGSSLYSPSDAVR